MKKPLRKTVRIKAWAIMEAKSNIMHDVTDFKGQYELYRTRRDARFEANASSLGNEFVVPVTISYQPLTK